MTRAPLALLLLSTLVATTAGCGGGSGGGGRSTTTAAVTSLGFRRLERGSSSALVTTATDLRTVTTSAALTSLWATHDPGASVPVVDFATEQVGALLLGERPTDGFGIEVTGVAEVVSGAATTFEVRYLRTSPAGPAAAVVTHPYDVVAVNRPASAGRLVFIDITPMATRPLAQVHGELVTAPALVGGASVLAFLPDGAPAPLEVLDLAPFTAAKLHEGFTLVLDGEASTNRTGATALAEGVRATAVVADDVVIGARLKANLIGVSLLDQDQRDWTPVGPLAAALLAHPLDTPVVVCGRADPMQQVSVGTALVVTEWRPATQLTWTNVKPLLGQDTLTVLDLDGTCAWRTASVDAGRGSLVETRGRGLRLDARAGGGLAADLRARVTAAALRTLPAQFVPPQLFPDHPLQIVSLTDQTGTVEVTVYAGATVPPALDALLTSLGALPAMLPCFRSIEEGPFSNIQTAGAETARDLQAWGSLLARHVGGRPLIPNVDFPREVAVGVFDGPRPSSGFSIEVTDSLRIGPHVHLLVVHRPPPGRPIPTPTAPFHLVAVDLTGGADLYVEGVKQ
jgi:hypothetical protein